MPLGVVLSIIAGEAVAGKLPPKDVPVHPHLSPVPGIHLDLFNSSVTDMPGPAAASGPTRHVVYGRRRARAFRKLGVGQCLNFMMDHEGHLVGFCGSPRKAYLGGIDFRLTLFDPDSYAKLDTYPIVRLKLRNLIRNDLPLNLGYFVMDSLGRVILVRENGDVVFVGVDEEDGRPALREVARVPVSRRLPSGYRVAQFLPDVSGQYYWFMALGRRDPKSGELIRPGLIGTYDPVSGEIHHEAIEGEFFENGLAMDRHGVYAVSDHASYLFQREAGAVTRTWREPYERATRPKKGTISRYGSGTTPTLLGDDLLVITDNADGRVNLLVYDRRPTLIGERLICKVPLFEDGKSANENSVVGYRDSIIVQNWYGASGFFGSMSGMEPGLARIDVRRDRSGCDPVWHNREIATTSTVKLSTATGLLYAPVERNRRRRWRDELVMGMIDYGTGEVVARRKLGRAGVARRTMMAPVNFGPGGTLIQPVFSGIITIRDRLRSRFSN